MSSNLCNHLLTAEFTTTDKDTGVIARHSINWKLTKNRKEFDATLAKFEIDKAAKTENASINTANVFLKDTFGERIHNHPELYRWRRNHLLVSMKVFDRTVNKMLKRTEAIEDLLDDDPQWSSHLFEFIYIIYLPKIKKFEYVAKGGRTLNWYGRMANYRKEHEVFFVVCLFCVKFGSPAEKKLMSLLQKRFGNPLKSSTKSENLGNEYFQIKGDVNDNTAIETLTSIGLEFASAMFDDKDNELIDAWYWSDCDEEVEKWIEQDVDKMDELFDTDSNCFSMMTDAHNKKTLKVYEAKCGVETKLSCMYNEKLTNDFIKQYMPWDKFSRVDMPWKQY